MNYSYSIKIVDQKGDIIGKRMDASPTDILKYISKGFDVIDIHTGKQLTESDVTERIGVSDGTIV